MCELFSASFLRACAPFRAPYRVGKDGLIINFGVEKLGGRGPGCVKDVNSTEGDDHYAISDDVWVAVCFFA
jgi:hypothetical protein